MSYQLSQPSYQTLPVYYQLELIVGWADQLCQQFLTGHENFRRRDQMTSSARSMKQNVAEGATRNSIKDYIQFIGYARASGEELLEDLKDLARKWQVVIWPKEDQRLRWWKESRGVRELRDSRMSRNSKPSLVSLPSDRASALNYLLDLVVRTNYLLDQQRRGLEKHFIEEGGYTENLAKKRREHRGY